MRRALLALRGDLIGDESFWSKLFIDPSSMELLLSFRDGDMMGDLMFFKLPFTAFGDLAEGAVLVMIVSSSSSSPTWCESYRSNSALRDQ